MRFKKVMAGMLSAALLGTMMCSTAFAAEYADGNYVGEVHFLNANGTGNKSMCDTIFVHEAEVKLDSDSAELKLYVAYPIPAFPDQGADGTVKDVVLKVNEQEYKAVSDISTKPEKEFDTDGKLFGITAGQTYPTQVLTVDVPREALDTLAEGKLSASAYVNVVMNSTQNFFIQLTNLRAVGEPEKPADDTKDMEITAEVEEVVSAPSYTVTVPTSVSMGTLSADEDNAYGFKVNVAASHLNGAVSVTAPEQGELASGGSKLAFTNSFGTQNISADTEGTELAGQISISKEAVKDAPAGNYTGTTTFSIAYKAN